MKDQRNRFFERRRGKEWKIVKYQSFRSISVAIQVISKYHSTNVRMIIQLGMIRMIYL